MSENIDFEIHFESTYADFPPGARIYVDDNCKFDGLIDKDMVITFNHKLDFNIPHQLRIERFNKEISRPINNVHQELILKKIKVDNIDIQNIIYSRSYNEPKYPEHWIKQNPNLESIVIAETHFGFNCTWKLNFTSPFYKFIMNCVSGKLADVPIY